MYEGITTLVHEWWNGRDRKLPDHTKGATARYETLVELLEILKQNGYTSEYFYTSTSRSTPYGIIMSTVFREGSGGLSKKQKDLRDNIREDLTQAVSKVFREERLAKDKPPPPAVEVIPDIPEQETIEEPAVPEPVPEPEAQPEPAKPAKSDFSSAKEANAALERFKVSLPGPASEPVYDERWSLVLGITKEDE